MSDGAIAASNPSPSMGEWSAWFRPPGRDLSGAPWVGVRFETRVALYVMPHPTPALPIEGRGKEGVS
jgi:hypothetical protein